MLQHYRIFSEGEDKPIEFNFDDDKTVRELVNYLFEKMGYYEPFGMDIVTLFNYHGQFIQDISEKCANAISEPDELTIAYHMPGVFYFAEGSWGHHMPSLANHPIIPNPVELKLTFDGFRNTVIINGNIPFSKMIQKLKKHEYISESASRLIIMEYDFPLDRPRKQKIVSFTEIDADRTLAEFIHELPELYAIHDFQIDGVSYECAKIAIG